MSSAAELSRLVLTRRLIDGTVEWVPLAVPQRVSADPGAAYALIDRADYAAPKGLLAQRRGDDLHIEVADTEVLVLEGFFAAPAVTFHPTPDIVGGAGPFSGTALTPESAALSGSTADKQIVWSAEPPVDDAPIASPAEPSTADPSTSGAPTTASASGGAGSAALLGGLAAGVGVLALAGGGGGSGGGSDGGSGGGPPVDTTAPRITSGTTATAIRENSGAGQVVYTATATDEGAITWRLATGGDAAAFSINASTGAVTLTGNPDFETKPSYSFTVVATDAANNSAQQAVSLGIEDQDDSAPFITSGATAAAIAENSGAGQVVYTATATDEGAITWRLATGGDASAFSINTNTGAVTLTGNPNFETKPGYSFTVIATDSDNNVSQQAVSLAINNVDEVAPTITSGATATAINENIGTNQAVYTVTSTDSGDISTGSTTYSLRPTGDGSAFTINANTGVVSLSANPNFETKSSYSFTVAATDAAGNSSQRAVTLAINNVDEIAPTITSGATAAAINENSGANQAVYTVTSTDTGDISSGSTTYSLSPTGDGAAFTINANTGVVRLIGNPNFEAKPSYSFTVIATDAAGNNSQRAVNLAINNLDEVAPTITSGAAATAITENSGANQAVYTVASTDTGDIATGNTSYSLSSINDGALFTINTATGVVRLIANPDFETKSSYNFTVVATDAAGNSAQQPVSLAINNIVDETAPTVASIALTGAVGAQNDTLNAGDTVQVTVTMSEITNVSTAGGTPRVALNVGGSTVFANFVSGSGSANLVFAYTVQSGNTDTNGISIGANALQLNGGLLTDATGNAAVLTHASVPDNPSFIVDTTAPTVASVALTGAVGALNNTLNAGDTVQVTVTMSENTIVSGTPSVALNVGGTPEFATFVSGSGTTSLVFAYTVQAGDTDANGISIAANALQLNGGTLTDVGGNAAVLSHAGAPDNPLFLVDTTAPTLSSSTPTDDAVDVAVDANIVLTFSDQIQAGTGNITISNGTDTRIINVTDATQVSFSGNQVTINPTSNLLANSTYNVQIANGALNDEAGNPYAGISSPTTLDFDTEIVADTSVVVFDLVQGSSSNHSGRTFQSGVSYDIYIRVDSNSDALSTSGGGPGTWGEWAGAANLGSDDRIILVGNGADVEGPSGPVTQILVNATAVAWQSSALASDPARLEGMTFTRITGSAGNQMDSADLFTAQPPTAFFSGQGGQTNTMYLTDMPSGILTSQGLV